jgi:NAD(P)H dehydrogenase (quinone)
MPKLLVLNGHPEPDSFTARLVAAYVEGAREPAEVRRIDLAALRFDPVLRRDHARRPLEPDLQEAAAALRWAEHVAWLFPTWWSGPPALVKGFLDRVLTPGFAYRYRGAGQLPEKLLAGRSARLVTSMDSPRYWYWFAQGRALHRAFVGSTLGFVGFGPVRSTTFYRTRFMTEAQRAAAEERVRSDARSDVAVLTRRAGSRAASCSARSSELS